MHKTLKEATTRPPAQNMVQQQEKFEQFVREYNFERPHEALAMKTPASQYRHSIRPYQGLPELEYPFHDKTIVVTECGRLCMDRKKINLRDRKSTRLNSSN